MSSPMPGSPSPVEDLLSPLSPLSPSSAGSIRRALASTTPGALGLSAGPARSPTSEGEVSSSGSFDASDGRHRRLPTSPPPSGPGVAAGSGAWSSGAVTPVPAAPSTLSSIDGIPLLHVGAADGSGTRTRSPSGSPDALTASAAAAAPARAPGAISTWDTKHADAARRRDPGLPAPRPSAIVTTDKALPPRPSTSPSPPPPTAPSAPSAPPVPRAPSPTPRSGALSATTPTPPPPFAQHLTVPGSAHGSRGGSSDGGAGGGFGAGDAAVFYFSSPQKSGSFGGTVGSELDWSLSEPSISGAPSPSISPRPLTGPGASATLPVPLATTPAAHTPTPPPPLAPIASPSPTAPAVTVQRPVAASTSGAGPAPPAPPPPLDVAMSVPGATPIGGSGFGAMSSGLPLLLTVAPAGESSSSPAESPSPLPSPSPIWSQPRLRARPRDPALALLSVPPPPTPTMLYRVPPTESAKHAPPPTTPSADMRESVPHAWSVASGSSPSPSTPGSSSPASSEHEHRHHHHHHHHRHHAHAVGRRRQPGKVYRQTPPAVAAHRLHRHAVLVSSEDERELPPPYGSVVGSAYNRGGAVREPLRPLLVNAPTRESEDASGPVRLFALPQEVIQQIIGVDPDTARRGRASTVVLAPLVPAPMPVASVPPSHRRPSQERSVRSHTDTKYAALTLPTDAPVLLSVSAAVPVPGPAPSGDSHPAPAPPPPAVPPIPLATVASSAGPTVAVAPGSARKSQGTPRELTAAVGAAPPPPPVAVAAAAAPSAPASGTAVRAPTEAEEQMKLQLLSTVESVVDRTVRNLLLNMQLQNIQTLSGPAAPPAPTAVAAASMLARLQAIVSEAQALVQSQPPAASSSGPARPSDESKTGDVKVDAAGSRAPSEAAGSARRAGDAKDTPVPTAGAAPDASAAPATESKAATSEVAGAGKSKDDVAAQLRDIAARTGVVIPPSALDSLFPDQNKPPVTAIKIDLDAYRPSSHAAGRSGAARDYLHVVDMSLSELPPALRAAKLGMPPTLPMAGSGAGAAQLTPSQPIVAVAGQSGAPPSRNELLSVRDVSLPLAVRDATTLMGAAPSYPAAVANAALPFPPAVISSSSLSGAAPPAPSAADLSAIATAEARVHQRVEMNRLADELSDVDVQLRVLERTAQALTNEFALGKQVLIAAETEQAKAQAAFMEHKRNWLDAQHKSALAADQRHTEKANFILSQIDAIVNAPDEALSPVARRPPAPGSARGKAGAAPPPRMLSPSRARPPPHPPTHAYQPPSSVSSSLELHGPNVSARVESTTETAPSAGRRSVGRRTTDQPIVPQVTISPGKKSARTSAGKAASTKPKVTERQRQRAQLQNRVADRLEVAAQKLADFTLRFSQAFTTVGGSGAAGSSGTSGSGAAAAGGAAPTPSNNRYA